MILVKLIGAVIFLWGAAVLGFGHNGTDLWALLPIDVPNKAKTFGPYVAMVIGAVIFFMAGSSKGPQRF